MKKSAFIIFLSFLFTAFLSAEDIIINLSEEDPGLNCENGGTRIDAILDKNGNGTFDEGDELKGTQYACNGTDGSAPAISVTDAGENCGAAGGVKITVGTDESYVCNGAAGTNGKNAVSRTSEELPGSNCEYGGIKIEVGIDNNGNGTLEDGEVLPQQTKYACNGADGDNGTNALVKISDEPKGNNCKNGTGIKIEVGIDTDGDGVLDEDEIDPEGVYYVCNGKNAVQGEQGDKGDQGEPGVNGTDGKDGAQGEKGETGPQGAQGAQGEQGEAGENGKNGSTSLVSVVDEPKGENCVSGGKKIVVGLDANGNGALDEDEIDPESVYYVCNGRDAEEAGLTSSSTGCSLNAVDETEDVVLALFALISALCAFAAMKFVRG
jgi:hypothetical protein